jgi:phosphoadenosine phosphosulfate reductase
MILDQKVDFTRPDTRQLLHELNHDYAGLQPAERIARLYRQPLFADQRVILTSSFGTTAVFLLHLLQELQISQPVYFLNTGYHFRETLAYKERLRELFSLPIIELTPEDWKHRYTRENKTWKNDPDLCCTVNKVEPMEQVRQQADIWMSGLMSWQNTHRKNLDYFQWQDGLLKFYPIIDVSEAAVEAYIKKHKLPVHPLKPMGYESVGCSHCTFKGKGRQGRWHGQSKTECGLHR